MKLRILWIAAIAMVATQMLAQTTDIDSSSLKTDTDKFSYALGMYYGGNWRDLFAKQGFELDLETVMKGLRDALFTNKTLLTETQMNTILIDQEKKWNERRDDKLKQQAVDNKKKSEEFLEANRSKPGVVTLPSGLQYKVISEGNGPMAHSNDTVTLNYKGTLIDGTEWDSTAQHGKPATFIPMNAPKFWSEAVQRMKIGSKWELFVPPDLAYGTNGYRSIPANAALIVEVELLTNAPPPAPPAASPSAPLTSEIIKVPSLEDMKKGAKIETLTDEDVKREIERQRTNGAPQPPKQP